ncbi:MAG: acyl carrier protein [Verrucomicrobia bacterium]|nr:acyl carrier protein [Verrucomicrobiota bacterium]
MTELNPSERLVIATLLEVMQENGMPGFDFTPQTHILRDSGMDSLGLALTIVKLEEQTGKDPFADGFVNFTTVAELAQLFALNE